MKSSTTVRRCEQLFLLFYVTERTVIIMMLSATC